MAVEIYCGRCGEQMWQGSSRDDIAAHIQEAFDIECPTCIRVMQDPSQIRREKGAWQPKGQYVAVKLTHTPGYSYYRAYVANDNYNDLVIETNASMEIIHKSVYYSLKEV